MAAAEIFDRRRRAHIVFRDRALLTAAAGMERFTISDVAARAGSTYWYGGAQRLLYVLRREGHIRCTTPEWSKPIVYEWAGAA